MGHNKGRDNVNKRARRRKKSERLALGKKKHKAATTREQEPRGYTAKQPGSWRKRGNAS